MPRKSKTRDGEMQGKFMTDASSQVIETDLLAHHLKQKSLKPRKRKVWAIFLSIGFVATALILARHPSRAPLLPDFISPAEKFISEISTWGNFTVTLTIRDAIRELFSTSPSDLDAVAPFYEDIISQPSATDVRKPVLFIPGYVTSGLELWRSKPCAKAKFRERIWGTASMVKLFLVNPRCWIDHMRLEPRYSDEIATGRTVHFQEPEGIHIQAASGLAAADFVLGDYWIWNPIIEALGAAGYDESLMSMLSYDWRLPLRDLEHKDRYFSRMALEIEKLVKLNGERVLIVTHSFGSKVWFYFLQWTAQHFSESWIDEHISVTYNIGGVFLGVPKAVAATLSGDTRDTAQLGALSTLLDTLLPPTDRSALFSGWGSVVDMLPQGGTNCWQSPMLFLNEQSMLVNDTLAFLFNTTAMAHHADHRKGDKSALRCPPGKTDPRSCYRDLWTDPTSIPLPKMGSSQIWCTYGVGIPTEKGYHYVSDSGNMTDNTGFRIEKTLHIHDGQVVNGIYLDDGDGTVPLESLGTMCSIGWRAGSKLNPGGATVKVRELPHGENYSVLSRAGAAGGSSVDHVDIMGNRQVVRDILLLALGREKLMDPPTADPLILKRNITLAN